MYIEREWYVDAHDQLVTRSQTSIATALLGTTPMDARKGSVDGTIVRVPTGDSVMLLLLKATATATTAALVATTAVIHIQATKRFQQGIEFVALGIGRDTIAFFREFLFVGMSEFFFRRRQLDPDSFQLRFLYRSKVRSDSLAGNLFVHFGHINAAALEDLFAGKGGSKRIAPGARGAVTAGTNYFMRNAARFGAWFEL